MLEILPREQMAALLEAELIRGGFVKDGELLRRELAGAEVVVHPGNGQVTVRSQMQDEVALRTRKEAVAFEDIGPSERTIRKQLRKVAQADLTEQVEERQTQLQEQVTETLEKHLRDLTPELNRAVNRVTAEALKRKAAQIGRIKELHEDAESQSLSITIEV